MPEWKYGSAGDKWPVKPREIWRAGPHWLMCGDLENGDFLDLANYSPRPDFCFVDPPFNQAVARAFRTKAGMPAPVDFKRFLRALYTSLSVARSGLAWVECGTITAQQFVIEAAALGAELQTMLPASYLGGNPCQMLLLNFEEDVKLQANWPTTVLDDVDFAHWAVQATPGRVVFDPCIGRGLTLAAADRATKVCVGMELHPRRLAVTLELAAQNGHEVWLYREAG